MRLKNGTRRSSEVGCKVGGSRLIESQTIPDYGGCGYSAAEGGKRIP